MRTEYYSYDATMFRSGWRLVRIAGLAKAQVVQALLRVYCLLLEALPFLATARYRGWLLTENELHT